MPVRMNGMGKKFEALNETGTGPIEVVRPIRHIDPPGPNSRQFMPSGDCVSTGQILTRPFYGETTTRNSNDVRLPGRHLIPSNPARWLPFFTKSLDTAGNPNKFRIPMAA